jgi:CubicO group peptidase (beta-lactamase class C family)
VTNAPAADLAALLERAEKPTRYHPRCATQVAVAHNGELLACETFGQAGFSGDPENVRPATNDTLFSIYSVTKTITSAAVWLVLQEGKLGLDDPVARHVPEFGEHGKDAVTVEQCLLHTSGFPSAQLAVRDWPDPERRLAAFASWRLEWPPGSRFVYHGTSGMWVLAELVTRCAGVDYRDFIRTRICEPLGLGNLHVGLPEGLDPRVADVVTVGEPASASERGGSPVDAPVIDESLLGYANDPTHRRIGGPGGGAIATAADVAMLYQGMLADAEGRGAGIWQPATLEDAWRIRHPELVDGMTGQPALRGLGVVVAGPEGKIWRGFAEGCSARAFGHMGAGGQVSWADPETGLSFCFLTNGAQQNVTRQGAQGVHLSTLAAALAAGAA